MVACILRHSVVTAIIILYSIGFVVDGLLPQQLRTNLSAKRRHIIPQSSLDSITASLGSAWIPRSLGYEDAEQTLGTVGQRRKPTTGRSKYSPVKRMLRKKLVFGSPQSEMYPHHLALRYRS